MMPVDLNTQFQTEGTRFRVFAQTPALDSITDPETICVSSIRGSIAAGPADDRMIVRDAINKSSPYQVNDFPPYSGLLHPPVEPNPEGHFDDIAPDSDAFKAAHVFAAVRRVLDVWEHYLGDTFPWHFNHVNEQLEIIPQVDWENSQSGFGFIEFGYQTDAEGRRQPDSLNFDIIAHEIGHSIIYSLLGLPSNGIENPEYLGFQESAADMTALIAVLHFDSVVDRLLNETSGNLYAINELNRFAEVSDVEQIRLACNSLRMSDFAEGWKKLHEFSSPLTGAFFDVLIEIYHSKLTERGLIDAQLASDAYASILPNARLDQLQQRFDQAYFAQHPQFKSALLEARDYLGFLLADVWLSQLLPDELTYTDIGHALLDSDLAIGSGLYQSLIFDCFAWREIGMVPPGPRLQGSSQDTAHSCR